jgi:hypothetical protein
VRNNKKMAGPAEFGLRCRSCPLADMCTTSKTGRRITISRHEARLTAARARQTTPAGRPTTGLTGPRSNANSPTSSAAAAAAAGPACAAPHESPPTSPPSPPSTSPDWPNSASPTAAADGSSIPPEHPPDSTRTKTETHSQQQTQALTTAEGSPGRRSAVRCRPARLAIYTSHLRRHGISFQAARTPRTCRENVGVSEAPCGARDVVSVRCGWRSQ